MNSVYQHLIFDFTCMWHSKYQCCQLGTLGLAVAQKCSSSHFIVTTEILQSHRQMKYLLTLCIKSHKNEGVTSIQWSIYANHTSYLTSTEFWNFVIIISEKRNNTVN